MRVISIRERYREIEEKGEKIHEEFLDKLEKIEREISKLYIEAEKRKENFNEEQERFYNNAIENYNIVQKFAMYSGDKELIEKMNFVEDYLNLVVNTLKEILYNQ